MARRTPPTWTLRHDELAGEERGRTVFRSLAARVDDDLGSVGRITRPLRFFLRLYLESTRSWLDYLKTDPEPGMGYQIIERFYDLFSVYARLAECGALQHSDHWRPFCLLSSELGDDLPLVAKWRLLYLGARAHIRFDLAEAIFLAHRDHCALRGRAPNMPRLKHLLLGEQTNDVFLRAALGFCDEHARADVAALADVPVVRLSARTLRQCWMPRFQRWRHEAWREAEAWIGALPPQLTRVESRSWFPRS